MTSTSPTTAILVSTTTETALAALSRAAEFIATHPELPTPSVNLIGRSGWLELTWHLDTNHAVAAQVVNALPGDWRESGDGINRAWFVQDVDDIHLVVHVLAYLAPVDQQPATLASVTALGGGA